MKSKYSEKEIMYFFKEREKLIDKFMLDLKMCAGNKDYTIGYRFGDVMMLQKDRFGIAEHIPKELRDLFHKYEPFIRFWRLENDLEECHPRNLVCCTNRLKEEKKKDPEGWMKHCEIREQIDTISI